MTTDPLLPIAVVILLVVLGMSIVRAMYKAFKEVEKEYNA